MVTVTVYSRQGCHLCEIAEKTLEDLGKAVQVFVNTTKLQSNKLKKTKAITTDTEMQKSKLNAQAGKVTAK